MDNIWFWFNKQGFDVSKEGDKDVNIYLPRDYYTLVKNKEATIAEIKRDPSVLFKRVCREANGSYGSGEHGYMCPCCDDEYYTTFLDMIFINRTLVEEDFLKLSSEGCDIDWFKLSQHVQLSNETLSQKKYKVNWAHISESYDYIKDITFIRLFHKCLQWSKVNRVSLTKEDAATLVFQDKLITRFCLKKRLLSEHDILSNQKIVIRYLGDMFDISGYGAVFIDKLDEIEDEVTTGLTSSLHTGFMFFKSCIWHQYCPIRYAHAIPKVVMNDCKCTWTEFIHKCQPKEDFVEKYIMEQEMPTALKNEAIDVVSGKNGQYKQILSDAFIEKYEDVLNWEYIFAIKQFSEDMIKKHMNPQNVISISKHQRLSSEFIDSYAHELDWYYLCEHQCLPEWLMKKHHDKVNWGQVSWYQNMSKEFLDEHIHLMNKTKLKLNSHVKSFFTD
jgi:hypothetical protein